METAIGIFQKMSSHHRNLVWDRIATDSNGYIPKTNNHYPNWVQSVLKRQFIRTRIVTILLLGAQEMFLHYLSLSMQLRLSHPLISSLSVGDCCVTGADLDAVPLSHLLAAMSTLLLLASSGNALRRHPCC